MQRSEMTATLRRLAVEAGAAIMEIYRSAELEIERKADESPVTAADLAADRIIVEGLRAACPGIPVVTEERAETHAQPEGARHFLVDPLDGTKEFIQRRGEFTVNIALIEEGAPVIGVVYAPAAARLFRTAGRDGAVEESGAFDPEREGSLRALAPTPVDNGALRVVASKSHRDPATDAFIGRFAVTDFRSAGSSLKFCLVAAGEADFYPRLGRTMEWDTAAGHAVLAAAGGEVLRLSDGAPLLYGKSDRANPHFVAYARGFDPSPAFRDASN